MSLHVAFVIKTQANEKLMLYIHMHRTDKAQRKGRDIVWSQMNGDCKSVNLYVVNDMYVYIQDWDEAHHMGA